MKKSVNSEWTSELGFYLVIGGVIAGLVMASWLPLIVACVGLFCVKQYYVRVEDAAVKLRRNSKRAKTNDD